MQDTVLVRVHTLPYAVNSVAVDSKGEVWISSAQGKCRWNGASFEVVDPYDFGGVAVYEGELLDTETFFERSGESPHHRQTVWDGLVPGSRTTLTSGKDSSGMWWVCDGAVLYNYTIVRRAARMLAGRSTRGMAWVGKRLAVQTYDGLFVDGRRMCPDYRFGDGNILVHGDSLYAFGMELAIASASSGPCRQIGGFTETGMTFQAGALWRGDKWVGNNIGFGRLSGDTVDFVWKGGDVRYVEASDEGIFLLTREKGVLRWDGSAVHGTGIPAGVFCSGMARGADGGWWLATDRGLGFWEPKANTLEFLTTADGLSSNAVCEVEVDRFGTVWCSTYHGINRYNPASGTWELHFPGVEFNRGSVAVGSDGDLWFGSVDGVYTIRPTQPVAATEGNPGSYVAWSVAVVASISLAIGAWVFFRWRRVMRQRQRSWFAEKEAIERSLFLSDVARHVLEGLPHSSVASVAQAMGMSERHLYRKAKEWGLSAGELIRDQKLALAQAMLASGRSRNEVAAAVGYTPEYLKRLLHSRDSGEEFEKEKGGQ